MRNTAFAVAVLFVAVPLFGGPIGSDLTLPVVGQIIRPEVRYTTELLVTNHRDVPQWVIVEDIDGTPEEFTRAFLLRPNETGHSMIVRPEDFIGARRYRAVIQLPFDETVQDDPTYIDDPDGRIEVKAFITRSLGRFGAFGTSRQEVEAVPSTEYRVAKNIFVGVRSIETTYTNVGITNLDPTETVTFYVHWAPLAAFPVTVGPNDFEQIRVPLDFTGFAPRPYLTITPEWALDGSGRTTPWVAYTSTVDGYTGDAFTGIRVPPDTVFNP